MEKRKGKGGEWRIWKKKHYYNVRYITKIIRELTSAPYHNIVLMRYKIV